MIKILDCTLRDGGYYTNWDFDKDLVNTYMESMNDLPVDYLEVGYRSDSVKGYLGKYFYSPIYELEDLKSRVNKKLVIILNEKDVKVVNLKHLLEPLKGLISMVRIALDPQYLTRAILLAEGIKKMGFEVGFNVMYMSKWKQYGSFISELKNVSDVADYFYMVDSYGGVYPHDVKDTISLVRENITCKIGFHGHNNLELALINSLTAIDNGIDIVDCTVMGMGRGAGNLKTELFLSVLNQKYNWKVNFNSLGNVVHAFEPLHNKYEWGTNLPYMISGSNSLPQKDVMDWVSTRFYSFNSIVQALQNQKENVEDNDRLPIFSPTSSVEYALIIGGGKSAVDHSDAIKEFINSRQNITVIHASSKNAFEFKGIKASQIFCLVGNEGHRMEKIFKTFGEFEGQCVLPPFPRKMGTYVPAAVRQKTFELPRIPFADLYIDSHTALALQTAATLKAKRIYIVGYDGYKDVPVSDKDRVLTQENEYLFKQFQEKEGVELVTLTSSNYKILIESSLYSFL